MLVLDSQQKEESPYLQESGGRRRKDYAKPLAGFNALSFLLCFDKPMDLPM